MKNHGKIELNDKLLLLFLFFIYAPMIFFGYSSNNPSYLTGVSGLSCLLLLFTANGNLSDIVAHRLQKLEIIFKYTFLILSVQWILLACVNYYAFNYHTWDTASFANPLSNMVQTGKLYNTFLERHALADHFSPNLLAFSPFFLIENSALWLTFAKIAAFLVCPFLLIRTGKIIELPAHLVYVAPILFLFHRYTTNTLLFEFQPSSLSMPFILLGFNCALEKKYLLTILFLVSLLGFKEHMALIWISIGVYILLIQGKARIGLFFIAMGIILGVFVFFVVMPYFSAGLESLHSNRFNPFSLYHEKGKLIFLSLLSVGFIPLAHPKSILFIVPSFGISLVSNNQNMMTFNYHYHDIAMVVLFIGVVLGLSRLNAMGNRFGPRVRGLFVMALILIIIIMNSSFPSQNIRHNWPDHLDFEISEEIKQIRQLVKKNTSLWVTERFSILFIDHAKLKSIDIWGGSTTVQKAQGSKMIILPKDPALSSLDHEKYEDLVSKLERDSAEKISSKNNTFKHFVVYFYGDEASLKTTSKKNSKKHR